MREFRTAVIEALGAYVYYLRDSRNQEVFYVGKGNGNRVFQHLNNALENPQETDKIDRITTILKDGGEVQHMILRHALTDDEAFLVESCLIDFFGKENITNAVSGHRSTVFGAKTAEEISIMYDAEPCEIDDPVLIININRRFERNMGIEDLYRFTRSAWVLGPKRENAKFALSSYRGICREVFEIHSWNSVPRPNESHSTRWEFTGQVASDSIRTKYLHKSLEQYVKKGAQNPVRYVNC